MLPLLMTVGRNPSIPVDPQIIRTPIIPIAVQPSEEAFLILIGLPCFLMKRGVVDWWIVRKPIVGIITLTSALISHDGFGRIGQSHSKDVKIPRKVMAGIRPARKARYVVNRLSARAGRKIEAENLANSRGLFGSRVRNFERGMVIVAYRSAISPMARVGFCLQQVLVRYALDSSIPRSMDRK